ncbi:ABC transporter substrate-binding protein [Aureimonas fodinaquatilis]|uniref:ABC transporter substrate-binding protein n=1 Tax=Aureimonas fodinaquatilis TaxID=2565783 RepID=A0A5B0DP50_9HYPH|nr:ABC transporter substrate-binding protein [Aureimonas fodinaquatilis]KAA0968208.1 ABC transporter substrate-binding protein [Aureimonas fodinaquatilis]
MKRHSVYSYAWGAALALALAGPAAAADLRIGMQDDPDVLDPAQSRTFAGRLIYTSLCDKLVDISKDVQIVPQLATDWTLSDDGLTMVMNLVENATFHDGTPFNAEAVAFNIERGKTLPESVRKSELASVEKVEVTGPYQVTITLAKPDASLLSQFSDRAGMMVSPTAAKEAGANFGQKPVCSGPYKFVERIQQDRVVLEKFAEHRNADDYHFDKLTFLPLPDSTVRLANLRSGDLDFVERMAATDAGTVEADPNLKVLDVTSLGYIAIYMNVGNGERAKTPIGEDKRIRQAFSKAIDREALIQIVYDGKATAGNQPFPPNSIWYNSEFPVEERDVEGAKALLAEAGHERLEIELQHPNNPVVTQMMQVIQAMVAEAGFDVRLRATEFATLLSEQTAGNYQLSRMNWSGRPDPDGSIHQFVTCGAGLNDTRYCNEEVDSVLNEARTIIDFDQRKALYDQATATLIDEVPILYLAHESYVYGMKKGVEGFELYPDGMIRLNGVTLAD